MNIGNLRNQLSDLKKKETIAQTREQLLNEEKQKLLTEIGELFKLLRELGVFSEEELTPSNLPNVLTKLQTHIENEITKSNLPQELS